MLWKVVLFVVCVYQVAEGEIIMSNREFYEKYVIKTTGESETSEAALSNAIDGVTAIAYCKLTELGVSVPKHRNPVFTYYPTHVYLKRCLGGCPLNRLACKPTIEQVQIRLMVTKSRGDKFELEGKEQIQMENHTDCHCECKEEADDCGPLKNHEAHNCECVCKDPVMCEEGMVWNKEVCKCECRSVNVCDDNEIFSPNTCKCLRDSSIGGTTDGMSQATFEQICPSKLCPPPQIIAFNEDPCICKFA